MSKCLVLAFLLLALPLSAQDDAVVQPPGAWGEDFDDGVISGEISPVGGATLTESGGRLIVATSAPFDGVRVTFPPPSGPEPVWPFCVMVGFDVAQLREGESVVFRVFDPQVGEVFARADEKEKVRWEITKVNDTTYNYKVYKDGMLVAMGQARIPAGSKGFRIDKKPGTNMIIGEVILPDGRWEKLWEKDPPPPELPFTAVEILSNAAIFVLDAVMGGLHTDDPNTMGAIGDLTITPAAEGGLRFHPVGPVGGNRYNVEVELESLATFASEGESTFPVSLEVGGRLTEVEVKCRGTGTGTCSGQTSCDTKTCPDREYDIGDGNGYRTYTGTCKLATIGLPLCSCSYKLKKTFSAVEIRPGETVSAKVDRTNVVPEFTEGDNEVSASPVRRVYAAPQMYFYGSMPRGISASPPANSRKMMLQTTVRVAGVGPVVPGSVQLMVSSTRGGLAGPFAPVATSSQGSTAYLSFYVPENAGVPIQPERLILVGASFDGAQVAFWSAESDARVVPDEEINRSVVELVAALEGFPPEQVQLGTLRVGPNEVTAQVLEFADLAIQTLIDTLSTGSLVQQAYSAYLLGEIGNPSAVPALQARLDQFEAREPVVTLEYSVVGAVTAALQTLTFAPPVEPAPADKRCCVTDTDAVTSGALKGGKKAGDYYPDLVTPRSGGMSPYWGGDGSKAGPFDKGNRAGALVQIVGTMDGDRACCSITQHYTIEESNYPGAGQPYGDSAPVGKRTDDIAQSGRDATKAPFRQNEGANQVTFADPVSNPYGPTSTFKVKYRFESCFVSFPGSRPPCEWSKCCVTWVFDLNVVNGAATTTVTKVGTFCE